MASTTYTRAGQAPRRPAHEAGQSMVEFALSLLVFLLLVLGIVDLSRAVYARNVVASVAREGARYAIVRPADTPDADIVNAAKALVAGLDRDELNVQVTRPDASHVQVEVTYTFHPATVLIGRFVDGGSGSGIVLRGRSKMRRE